MINIWKNKSFVTNQTLRLKQLQKRFTIILTSGGMSMNSQYLWDEKNNKELEWRFIVSTTAIIF